MPSASLWAACRTRCRAPLTPGWTRVAVDPGPAAERGFDLGDQLLWVAAQPKHDLRHDAVRLLQQRQQQVLGLDLRVVIGFRLRLRLDQCFLRALGEFVLSHIIHPHSCLPQV